MLNMDLRGKTTEIIYRCSERRDVEGWWDRVTKGLGNGVQKKKGKM